MAHLVSDSLELFQRMHSLFSTLVWRQHSRIDNAHQEHSPSLTRLSEDARER